MPTLKSTIPPGEPTPPEVHQAMDVIRRYLQRGNWVQCIINADGGASFRLTDIYDIFGETLDRHGIEITISSESDSPSAGG